MSNPGYPARNPVGSRKHTAEPKTKRDRRKGVAHGVKKELKGLGRHAAKEAKGWFGL